jgi:hypothetical protein
MIEIKRYQPGYERKDRLPQGWRWPINGRCSTTGAYRPSIQGLDIQDKRLVEAERLTYNEFTACRISGFSDIHCVTMVAL